MSRAIILDTETTGFDDPDVIELAATNPLDLAALRGDGEMLIQCDRFKPRKAIGLGAVATHHIFESDLQDKPLWPGSWPVPAGVSHLIGHAIDFDWSAIGSPAVKRIDTLALGRAHFPEVDSHSLTALSYLTLGQNDNTRNLLRGAHSADVDVWLCFSLLLHLLTHQLREVETWEQLWLASERARIPTRFSFGKFHGELIADVRRNDPGYIRWCLSQDNFRNDVYLAKALRGEAA